MPRLETLLARKPEVRSLRFFADSLRQGLYFYTLHIRLGLDYYTHWATQKGHSQSFKSEPRQAAACQPKHIQGCRVDAATVRQSSLNKRFSNLSCQGNLASDPVSPVASFTPLVHSAGPHNHKEVGVKGTQHRPAQSETKLLSALGLDGHSLKQLKQCRGARPHSAQRGLPGVWVGDLQRCGWLPPKHRRGITQDEPGSLLGQARDEVHAHGVDGLPTSHSLTRLSDSCLDSSRRLFGSTICRSRGFAGVKSGLCGSHRPFPP